MKMSGANTKMSLASDARDEVDYVKINGNHSYNNNNCNHNNNNNNNNIDKYTVHNGNGSNNSNNCNSKVVHRNEASKPNQTAKDYHSGNVKSQLIDRVPNLFQDKLSFRERFSIFNLKKKLSPSMTSLTTVGTTTATPLTTEQNLANGHAEGEKRNSNSKEAHDSMASVPVSALTNTSNEADDSVDKKKLKKNKKAVSMAAHQKVKEETEKNPDDQKSSKPIIKSNDSNETNTSKFRRSSSLVRLFGGSSSKQSLLTAETNGKVQGSGGGGKFNTFSGRRKSASSSSKSGPYLERFKRHAKDSNDEDSSSILLDIKQIANDFDNGHSQATIKPSVLGTANTSGASANHQQSWQMPEYRTYEEGDLTAKALRTVSRSLGKLWWKRTHSVDISTPDPEYKVSYLGNVLTGWAKGKE